MAISQQHFREIAILGLGLLGGSLALALQGKSRVRLWGRRAEAVAEARELEIADVCTTNLEEAVSGADLILLCTPIETMGAISREIVSHLGDETLVTDVGSVKSSVCEELLPIFGAARFVGSHPMAGSEQSGVRAAKADLFQGAICILTPYPTSPDATLSAISQFWTRLGCELMTLTPEQHDQQIGLISHLPHLLAGCLVNTVAESNPTAFGLVGQGFRDSTRIASGPPAMWSGILKANRTAVLNSLQNLKNQIQIAEELLQAKNEEGLRNFLSTAKTKRDGIIRKVRYGGN